MIHWNSKVRGSPPRKITSTVVQKLPKNHKRTVPEMATNKIARVNPTKTPIRAAKA